MKFQALGSNYNFVRSVRHLFTVGHNSDHKLLQNKLENYFGGTAVLFSKGRNALSAAVAAAAPSGSYVGVNAMTCSVVIEAIKKAGALPYYIDVDSKTAHFTAKELQQALKHQPLAAIIIQNTYGNPCDIGPIETIARTNKIVIVEDTAHSIGQKYSDGRQVGTVGALTMISFGRDKVLDVVNGGALIQHGAIEARPPKGHVPLLSQLRDRLYPLFMWLYRATYAFFIGKIILRIVYGLHLAEHSADGGISATRMPNWQAKLACCRLDELDSYITHRELIMGIYRQYFDTRLIGNNAFIRAAVSVSDRKALLTKLRQTGYELTDTWYDTPIGPARKYRTLDYPVDTCQNAVMLSNSIINLPTHAEIAEHDAETISHIVTRHCTTESSVMHNSEVHDD